MAKRKFTTIQDIIGQSELADMLDETRAKLGEIQELLIITRTQSGEIELTHSAGNIAILVGLLAYSQHLLLMEGDE